MAMNRHVAAIPKDEIVRMYSDMTIPLTEIAKKYSICVKTVSYVAVGYGATKRKRGGPNSHVYKKQKVNICQYCGEEFTTKSHKTQKTCSFRCGRKLYMKNHGIKVVGIKIPRDHTCW